MNLKIATQLAFVVIVIHVLVYAFWIFKYVSRLDTIALISTSTDLLAWVAVAVFLNALSARQK
jgi:hypothetical protein